MRLRLDEMRAVAQGRWMLRTLWRGLRDWSGDSAYERYLRVAARKTAAASPGCRAVLSEKQFYVEQLNRKYSRPNRCC